MERERWLQLYNLAGRLSYRWGYGYCFSTACIVGVFLWAVIHDHPISWACEARHWPAEWRVGKSKDPEARWGRGAGGLAKGYKLHAVWSCSAIPVAWVVYPMNVSEKTVAEELIGHLSDTGYLLGDPGYDSNRLYDWAAEHGHRLLAPRRKKGNFIHGYTSVYRRMAVEFLEHGGYSVFHRIRTNIERKFGNCTSFAGGLAPLPAWTRRLQRVRLWVQAKLLINAIRAKAKLAIA